MERQEKIETRTTVMSGVLKLMLDHDDVFLADLAQYIKDYSEAKDDGVNYER